MTSLHHALYGDKHALPPHVHLLPWTDMLTHNNAEDATPVTIQENAGTQCGCRTMQVAISDNTANMSVCLMQCVANKQAVL